MAFRAKDPVAYAKGELVEPIKPIVYYILTLLHQKNFVNTSSRYRRMAKPFETAGLKTLLRKTHQRKKKIPILVQRIYGIR
jgi:hypothetical protein